MENKPKAAGPYLPHCFFFPQGNASNIPQGRWIKWVGGQDRTCLEEYTVLVFPKFTSLLPCGHLLPPTYIPDTLLSPPQSKPLSSALWTYRALQSLGLCCTLRNDTKFLFPRPTLNPTLLLRCSQQTPYLLPPTAQPTRCRSCPCCSGGLMVTPLPHPEPPTVRYPSQPEPYP